jgi:choline oxidase
MSETAESVFDYIVVGGGASGAPLAARLAEDPNSTVCLIEAGPSDEDPPFLELNRWSYLLGGEHDFNYEIEQQERGNSELRQNCSRVLGGCTSHNAGIAFRPLDVDMNEWAHRGAAGWDAKNTSPYVQRVWDKVNIETIPDHSTAMRVFVAASELAGYPFVAYNEQEVREGVGWHQLTVHGNARQSASVAYLHPLRQLPPNLTLMLETTAARIIFNQRREAVGVLTSRGEVRAEREVIVCAGAFESPKLLMLSGVGPASSLAALGFDVVADLPAVGQHLMDHPLVVLSLETTRPIPPETTQYFEAVVWARSQSELEYADIMISCSTLPYDYPSPMKDHSGAAIAPERTLLLAPDAMRARSEGTITLRSANPADPPRIDWQYLSDSADERALIAGVGFTRHIAEQEPLRAWLKREASPGPIAASDREILEHVRRATQTGYHPMGTCRMGREDDDAVVVDPSLRVRGVARLRVADASIFPATYFVNPMITCMMIGEKQAVEAALREVPWLNHRHTVQHCQLASADQYRRMANLGMCANLFSNHLWYRGDQHYEITVGPERAKRMNACSTARREGVHFSLHSDASVTPLDRLHVIWCAVNRVTPKGRVLSEEERISVYDALYAATVDAAYQLHMDQEIGSIEVGKRADFTVLEASPLEVDPMELKEYSGLGHCRGWYCV